MKLSDCYRDQIYKGLRVHSLLSDDDGTVELIDETEYESIYYIFWDSGFVSEGPLSTMDKVEVIH